MTSNMAHKNLGGTNILPSNAVWGNLPVKNWAARINGQYDFLDFADAQSVDDAAPGEGVVLSRGHIAHFGATGSYDRDLTDFSLKITSEGNLSTLIGPQFLVNLTNGSSWAIEARVKCADADGDSFFLGLASMDGDKNGTDDLIADDSIMTAADALVQNRALVGIYKDDGSAVVQAIAKRSGTLDANRKSVTGATLTDSSGFKKYGMVYRGGDKVRFYIDGSELASSLSVDDAQYPQASVTYNSRMLPVFALEGNAGDEFNISFMAGGHSI